MLANSIATMTESTMPSTRSTSPILGPSFRLQTPPLITLRIGSPTEWYMGRSGREAVLTGACQTGDFDAGPSVEDVLAGFPSAPQTTFSSRLKDLPTVAGTYGCATTTWFAYRPDCHGSLDPAGALRSMSSPGKLWSNSGLSRSHSLQDHRRRSSKLPPASTQ